MNHSCQNGGKCKCGGKCQAATNEMLEWVRATGPDYENTSKVPLVLVYAVVGLVFYYYAKKNKWLEA